MYQILGRALTFSLPSPGIEGGMGLDVLMEAKTKKKSTRVNDSENIIFLVVDLVLMLGLMRRPVMLVVGRNAKC